MAARFYLDENVPERLVAALLALGYLVVSTAALGRKRTPDHRQLLFAAQTDRILVTYDGDDFRSLHQAWREWSAAWGTSPDRARHAGILVIQQDKSGLDVAGMARVIDELMAGFADPGELANRLFAWTRIGGWHEVV